MKQTTIQRGAADRGGHDPRAAALAIVSAVFSGTDASQAVLDRALRESHMVPSDKGLCTELVYGYLRWSLRLELELGRLLKNPGKLPEEMLLTLGLAAYELAFLSRIPAHASVNWAVTRVRNRFGKGLAGVANGVLRAFAREAKQFDAEDRYAACGDAAARLGARYSLPAWVVSIWLAAYGEEQTLLYLRGSSSRPVVAVRVNAAREGAAGLKASLANDWEGVPAGAFGVGFPTGAPYAAAGLEKEGRLSFQSGAVQEALEELGLPLWQGPAWDACAGRGGKTAAMLERGCAVAAATDMAAIRIQALRGELARLGLDAGASLAVCSADATLPPEGPPFSNKFATILVDAPCSGLGTLSRRPEIRVRRKEVDLPGLLATQDALLDTAAAHLLPGGRLVYLTCTLNPAENEERVQAFLARHSGFVREREWSTPPASLWHEYFYGVVLVR